MKTNALIWIAACFVIGGCSSSPKVEPIATTADPAEEVSKLQKDMAEVEHTYGDILAPRAWQKASDEAKDAEHKLNKPGAAKEKILRDIERARAWLRQVKATVAEADSTIPDILEARRLAMDARASEYASREWDDAESAFRKATRENEEAKLPITEGHRADLRSNYITARIVSLQNMYLGDARAAIHESELQRGRDLVPHFYNQAIRSLRNAEGFIAANNTDMAGITMLTERATADAKRALRMARGAVAFKRSTPEQAAFTLDKFKRRSDRLDDALATENYEQKFEDAQRVFSSDEAEVYRQGDKLVLRLKGIRFPFGSSAVPSDAYALLSKAGDVIKSFGNAKVVIQGHADAIGGSKVNEEISQARADAVRSYLVANTDLKADRVNTVPMSYERPLASNKSDMGRAENRRVDVVIIPESESDDQVGQQRMQQ